MLMELNHLDQETLLKKARSRVLRLLGYRARSAREVEEYLERKGYSKDLADRIIEEMKSYGYLDDHRFAADFISFRKTGGHGSKKIRYELQARGVDRQIVDRLIDENFNPEEDLDRIRELLTKREPFNGQVDQRWVNRQAAFLKRRGFPDGLILKALKNYDLSE